MSIPAQASPASPALSALGCPFEGPEKLLEIWFAPSPDELPSSHEQPGLRLRPTKGKGREAEWQGLRRVGREVWEEMLDIVKCKVLSYVEGADLDAYLLSESSMFVAPHLIILKTCGTTLNLLGLHRIIEIACEYCGFRNVWRCFYSRKSFFFPERQIGPHKGWQDEVAFLDGIFGTAGSAYTVGPMNRDHWLLYLTTPNTEPQLPLIAPPPTAHLSRPSMPSPPLTPAMSLVLPTHHQDQTLEILMTHLEPDARAPFFHPEATGQRSGHELGAALSAQIGLDALFPKNETTLDSFGFEPCGYSANAVVGTGSPLSRLPGSDLGGGYFTVHVTPEEGWSFASFESNVPLPRVASGGRPDLQTLIRNVVSIFRPNRLSITLFVSSTPNSSDNTVPSPPTIAADLLGLDYVRKDRIGYEFEGYDFVFGCFEKKGWTGPVGPLQDTLKI